MMRQKPPKSWPRARAFQEATRRRFEAKTRHVAALDSLQTSILNHFGNDLGALWNNFWWILGNISDSYFKFVIFIWFYQFIQCFPELCEHLLDFISRPDSSRPPVSKMTLVPGINFKIYYQCFFINHIWIHFLELFMMCFVNFQKCFVRLHPRACFFEAACLQNSPGDKN